MTPVTASDETQDFAIKEEDVPLLLNYYTDLADRFYERMVAGKHEPVSWFHKFLERILYGQRFNVACGGGRGYIGVSVDGGCYICHRFFGSESGYMGNIHESLDRSFTDKIESSNIDDRSECGECWARRYCGGPCYFEAYFHHQDFFTPNPISCAIIRHSVQESFKLYSKLLKNHPEIIAKIIGARKNIKPDMFSIQSCRHNANDESLLPDSVKPKQRNSIQFHSVDGELLLYDTESQHVSTVNQSAKAIWNYCDGQNDILTISEKLTEQFDCNPADIFPDVCRAINHFEKIGFLELA
ncbi:MAG: SPASM domain-containing protein [Candidatus Electrothrix sp. LOE1_4_5]|nr:SPASM domain-containing protein [Candidatus Electrothrix gigas]